MPKTPYDEGFEAAFNSYCPYDYYTKEWSEWIDGYQYGRLFVVVFENKAPPRPLTPKIVKREWKKLTTKELSR